MIAGAEPSPIKSRNTTNKTTDFWVVTITGTNETSSKPIASYENFLIL